MPELDEASITIALRLVAAQQACFSEFYKAVLNLINLKNNCDVLINV